jgi:uncharacterized membrane protein YcgQ (UPF0703/DUF1980 family)
LDIKKLQFDLAGVDMKSKLEKHSKKIEEKIKKKEKQEAALVDWFVRVIIAHTLKEFYGKK